MFWFFLLENLRVYKIPFFWGGGVEGGVGVLEGGGGSANFIFMGVGIFRSLHCGSQTQNVP